MQCRGFLGGVLAPLSKAGLHLVRNVLTVLAKSILVQLELTAAASAAGTGIHKKVLGTSNDTNTFTLRTGWYHKNS